MLTQKIEKGIQEYQNRLESWMLDHHLLSSHDNYQKFVIVCNIRTGSTLLGSLLSSHPQTLCFFELFHRHLESIPFSVLGYRAKSSDRKIVSLRNNDPARFLQQEIYKPQHPRIKAVGFKLLYPQGRADNPWWNSPEFDRWWKDVGYEPSWSSAKSDVWTYLKDNTDIAIVHLKRKNLLRSKVSGKTAQKTGNWGIGATGGIGNPSEAVKFKLDFNECLQDFEAHRRMEDETDEFFANHRVLSVTYEDLVGNPTQTTNEIQRFLSLDIQSLATKTKKQASKPLSDIIQNYQELQEAFSNTSWVQLFED
ncbi:MAG: Stf0 family sulfotransferase [Cyanobacteria bacterium J06592_8]